METKVIAALAIMALMGVGSIAFIGLAVPAYADINENINVNGNNNKGNCDDCHVGNGNGNHNAQQIIDIHNSDD